MPRPIQQFQVGLKAFVQRADGRLLLLRERATGLWEIPGGRIDVGEEARPQAEVLARELREELGADFVVEPGPLTHTWIRPRPPTAFTFLIGRLCRHRGGELRLSDEHDAAEWVSAETWRARPLAPGYAESLAEFWRLLPALGGS